MDFSKFFLFLLLLPFSLAGCNGSSNSDITERLDRLETKQDQLSTQCILDSVVIRNWNQGKFPEVIAANSDKHKDFESKGLAYNTDFVTCPEGTSYTFKLSGTILSTTNIHNSDPRLNSSDTIKYFEDTIACVGPCVSLEKEGK